MKIAREMELDARASQLSLALHDLVNGRFDIGVRLFSKDFETGGTGSYLVRASWRMMPLFLVSFECSGQSKQVEVLTESQIEDGFRQSPLSAYWRMMSSAREQLAAKQRAREANHAA